MYKINEHTQIIGRFSNLNHFPGGKVRVIPFKCALLRTRITRAQRVIACALRAINLHVRVDCA